MWILLTIAAMHANSGELVAKACMLAQESCKKILVRLV